MSWPLFVNWHTPEYAGEAARLRASLERFCLPHRIDCSPSLGSWGRNTCFKPTFIRQALARSAGGHTGVVWIDADAELVEPPGCFFDMPLGVDLAYCERPLVYSGRPEGQMGMLYARACARTLEFLDAWALRCAEVYCNSDQTHFNALVAAGGVSGLTRMILPAAYCVMPEDSRAGAVILQHQASRRLARVTGSEPPPEFKPEARRVCVCRSPRVLEMPITARSRCADCGLPLNPEGGGA